MAKKKPTQSRMAQIETIDDEGIVYKKDGTTINISGTIKKHMNDPEWDGDNQGLANFLNKMSGTDLFKAQVISTTKSTSKAGDKTPKTKQKKETDLYKLALEFVLFENKGSVDSAIKQVDSYKADGVGDFISKVGGADYASKLLQSLKK